MACYHLHADESGETYLSDWVLPVRETPAGAVFGVSDIPTSVVGMGGFVDRKPDQGLHGAPRRQFVLVLRGALEVETSLGRRTELGPGDLMLADDVGSRGHYSRDVGEEPLTLMTIAVATSWTGPEPKDQGPKDQGQNRSN